MRGGSAVLALLFLPLAMCACQPAQGVVSQWPSATSERTVPGPGGPAVWPLTGLPAPSARATRQRVVAVKVDNSAQGRPQSGLGQADVVYETMAEGGVTRYTALYQSNVPASVGPVRSARAVDLFLVAQYRAAFAHVGAESKIVRELSDRKRFADVDENSVPGPFRRAKARSAPYDVYVDAAAVRASAVKRGATATATVEGPSFALQKPPGATSAGIQVDITYSSAAKVEWRWDAAVDAYDRYIDGHPDIDAESGHQLRTQNVVVLWTRQSPRPHRDAAGQRALDILLSGSGRASAFRQGSHTDGVWQAGPASPPQLTTSDGRLIRFEPGTTWYEVVANDQDVIMR